MRQKDVVKKGHSMMREETITESLIALLLERNLITLNDANKLRQDFARSDETAFISFLKDEGVVERDDLLEVLSELYQRPSFDAVGHFFDHQQLLKFPKDFLLRYGIIPLEVDENVLIIVAADPEDPNLLKDIGEHVSYDIHFYVSFRDDICDAVKEYYDTAITEVTEDGEPLEDNEVDEVEMEILSEQEDE
jgi:hypothetical protein